MANPYAQGLGGVGGSSYPQAGARSASPRRSLYGANSSSGVFGAYGLNDSPRQQMDYRYGRDDKGPGPQPADYRYGRDDKSGEMMPMVGQSMPYYAPPQRPVSFGGAGVRGSAERILGNVSRLPTQAYNAFSDVAQFPSRVMSEGLGNMSGISGRNAAPRPRQAATSNPYRAIDNLGQQAYGAAKGFGNAFNSLNTYLGSVAPQLGSPSLSYDEYKAYSPDITPSEAPSQAQQNYDAKWATPNAGQVVAGATSQPMGGVGYPYDLEGYGVPPSPQTTTLQNSAVQQTSSASPPVASQNSGEVPTMAREMDGRGIYLPYATGQMSMDWRQDSRAYPAAVQAAMNSQQVSPLQLAPGVSNVTGADGKPMPNPGPASAVGARYEGGPSPESMARWGVTPYSVALGQNPTYDNVAPELEGTTRDLKRAQVANAYDPQSWYTMGTTPAEQQADAAKRVANVGANYQSTIRQDPYSPLAGPGAAAGYNAMAAQDKARQQASDAAYQANRQKNLEAKAKSDAAIRAQGRDPDQERRESATLNAQYYNYIRASRAGGTKPVSYTDFAAIMKGGNAPQTAATQAPTQQTAATQPVASAPVTPPVAPQQPGTPQADYNLPVGSSQPEPATGDMNNLPSRATTAMPEPATGEMGNLPSRPVTAQSEQGAGNTPYSYLGSLYNAAGRIAGRVGDLGVSIFRDGALPLEVAPDLPVSPNGPPGAAGEMGNLPSRATTAQPVAPQPDQPQPAATQQPAAPQPPAPQPPTATQPPMAPQQPAAPVPVAPAPAAPTPTTPAQNAASDPNYPFNNTEPMPTPAGRNLPTRDDLENMLQAQRNSVNQARQAVKDDRERRRLVGGPSLPMAAYMMNRYGIPMTLGMPREEAERQRYIENLGMSGLLPASYRANVIAQQQANLNNNTADVNQELIRANALRDTALTRGLADVQTAQIQADMLNTRMNAEEQAKRNEQTRQEQELQSQEYRQHMESARAATGTPPAVRDQAEYQVLSEIRNSSTVPLIPPLEARFRVLDSRFGNSQPNNAQTVYGTPASPPVQGGATAPSGGANSTPAVPTIKDPRQRSQAIVSVLSNNVDTTSGNSYENFASLANQLAAAGVSDITQQELLNQLQNTPLGQALGDKAKASAFLDSYLDSQEKAANEYLGSNRSWAEWAAPYLSHMVVPYSGGALNNSIEQNYKNAGVQKFNQMHAPELSILKNILGPEYVNRAIDSRSRKNAILPNLR